MKAHWAWLILVGILSGCFAWLSIAKNVEEIPGTAMSASPSSLATSSSPTPAEAPIQQQTETCSINGIRLGMARAEVEKRLGVPSRSDGSAAYYQEQDIWIWYDGSLVRDIRGPNLSVGEAQLSSDAAEAQAYLLKLYGEPDPAWQYSFSGRFPYLVYRGSNYDLVASLRDQQVGYFRLHRVNQPRERLSKE
ncbi:MAG: hypothetical protein AB7S38_43295 [Vulcanimicrobiota bacterium]